MQIKSPVRRQIRQEVWIVSCVSLWFPAPRLWATRTLTPLPMPIRNPVNSVTRRLVDPTDPSAR